jgi:DNA-binding phage protein
MDSTQYAAAVAANVEKSIAAAGRSVLSVALETGIPRTTLDRRLRSNGVSPFSVTELKLIADLLGTTARDLTTVYADSQAIPA